MHQRRGTSLGAGTGVEVTKPVGDIEHPSEAVAESFAQHLHACGFTL